MTVDRRIAELTVERDEWRYLALTLLGALRSQVAGANAVIAHVQEEITTGGKVPDGDLGTLIQFPGA